MSQFFTSGGQGTGHQSTILILSTLPLCTVECATFFVFPASMTGDAGDSGSIPESGLPEGGHDNPLQYYCWENSMDGEPGGLWFMGSQRVGHDWRDQARVHALYSI